MMLACMTLYCMDSSHVREQRRALAAQVVKGLLVQQLSNTNMYAVRCASPNYSWAQHLADANRTGTCQQQNLASSKAQWDFVVLQARLPHASLRQPAQRVSHSAQNVCRLPSMRSGHLIIRIKQRSELHALEQEGLRLCSK